MKKKINLIVKESNKDMRVDVFINSKENEISRTRIKNLILGKKLKINNKVISDPAKKVLKDDVIELIIPEPKKASLKPFKFKLDIVHEDKDIIVLNKPAGIVMHPGAGNFDNTIVNALMDYDKDSLSNIGDELRPGIVHRIDKNTSGLVVIAKGLPLVYIFDETRNILLNGSIDYTNLKQAYLLNLIYLIIGIVLFYLSFLRARIKGTLINMGE